MKTKRNYINGAVFFAAENWHMYVVNPYRLFSNFNDWYLTRKLGSEKSERTPVQEKNKFL